MTATTILVVEDNPLIALDLKQQLTALGYEVIGNASSGEEALRHISRRVPDAVLMDIGLRGDMDGIETATRIPVALEIAVIYLSGSSAEATLNRARETRPYGYIIKPFSDRELHATIQMALERRQAAIALRAAEQRLEKANATLQVEVAARIKSEQEIGRERDTAQRYLDVAGVMILKLDAHGVVTLINNRGCAILGFERPADIVGINWIETFVPLRIREIVQERFQAMVAGELEDRMLHDTPIVTRSGEERMIAWHSVILKDELGNAVGTLNSGDDVTERYRAEADQRRLAAIVESSDAAIVGKTLDGIVTDWNKAAERIFGYTAEEMVGESVALLGVPDRPNEFGEILELVGRGVHISQFESVRRTKDGRHVPVLLSVSPIRDGIGRIIGASKIVNDITELQQTRTEREELVADLRKTQERLLAAQRISQLGHWEYDPDRCHLWWSNQIFELFGISTPEPEVTWERFFAIVDPRDRILLFNIRSRLSNSLPLDVELRILQPTGQVRWMHFRASLEHNPRGARNSVGTVQDITERKNAEARLHEMQSELLHVSRLSAMGQISSTLAHEVNQPLTAIGNYIRASLVMLESGDSSVIAKIRGVLEKAAQQAGRASDIVGNLREFVRKGEAVRKREDLKTVIEDAITLSRLGPDGSSVKFEVEMESGARIVDINRIQIQQVLVNLMRNAMEAMEQSAPREIVVSARQHGCDATEVCVADSGPGLPTEIEAVLFKPFITTKLEGMGVGLAICRSIVEAHGGKIWADTNQSGGATFHFTVLMAREERSVESECTIQPPN